jgi:CcmD family protein
MKRLACHKRLFYLITLLFLLLQFNGVVGVQLHAQIAPSEQSPENRSRVFEAVEGMQVEEVSGAKLLLAAYALFWLLLFAYVVRLARIQDKTRDDLNRLERLLSKAARPNCDEDKPEPEES